MIDKQSCPGRAARAFGLDREFHIPPGRPTRSAQLEIRQAGRDLGVRCGRGREPRQIDPSTGCAGERHILEFEHLTSFGHERVEVERPLHGRRLGGAEGRHLHGWRRDPRLFNPQPVASGRAASAPQPGGEWLVPTQQSLLPFATIDWPTGRSLWLLLGRDDALDGLEVPRTGTNLQHAFVAIGPCDGRELQLSARHAHVGPHGEATGHGPRGGSEIDIRGDREILSHERLGPVPRASGRQADPARGLGLEQLRGHLQRPHRDPVAIDRQIDRHLTAIERDQFRQRVGLADRQMRCRHHAGHANRLGRRPRGRLPRRVDSIPGDGVGRRQCDVEPHIGESVEHVRGVEPRGEHTGDSQWQPGGGHGERAWLFNRLIVGRRYRPAAVSRENGGGASGNRRAIEPAGTATASGRLGLIDVVRPGGRLAGSRWPGGVLHPVRGDAVGCGVEIPQRRAGMPRAARDGPAGEGRIGPHGSRRQQIADPPGVIAFEIDQFDRGIDDLQLERRWRAGGLHDRGQPGCEDVLDRAATAADLDERLAADEPHRAEIARIDEQARQPTVDHHAGHGHQRPPVWVAEHHVAVFDGAPPLPLGRAAGHPAVDA